MRRRHYVKKADYKLKRELYDLLGPVATWWDDKGDNEQAKVVLHNLYELLLKRKPDKFYDTRDIFHFSYFFHLLNIRKAFEAKKYYRVCNEIMSLVHYEPFYQPRIYWNVIRLLERYLEVSDHAVEAKMAQKN